MNLRFKPYTPVIIYGILAAGLAAILYAWYLMPKSASAIVVFGPNGHPSGSYQIRDLGDTLRYRMDDTTLKVYWKGRTDIYPMSSVQHIELRR